MSEVQSTWLEQGEAVRCTAVGAAIFPSATLALVFLNHGLLHSEDRRRVISQRSPGSQGMAENQSHYW